MLQPLGDTIVAIASAPGGAARGIVRLSGHEALACLGNLFQPDGNGLPAADRPGVWSGSIRLPGLAAAMPCRLFTWPARRSYTGDLVIEIHTLGSPPLLERLVRILAAGPARLAEAGEFTLRAFLSGRIDLTRAEAVLGVIDAPDRRALDAALAQLAGGLARPLTRLRDDLVDLLAHLEAGLDFADEDLSLLAPARIRDRLADAAAAVDRVLAQMNCRGHCDLTAHAVLVGAPNTGKSSLFNSLAEGDALVSDQSGTTRDYLAAQVDLDGLCCTLVDTAGRALDQRIGPPDSIADAAQAAAADQASGASIRIFCLDATRPINAWERRQLAVNDQGRLAVLTKVDAVESPAPDVPGAIATSSRTGQGIDHLRARLREALVTAASPGDVVLNTATRCRDSLRAARESLAAARSLSESQSGNELVAAELRTALDELGRVVGAVYTEDLLDRIFGQFCIGK